MALQGPIPIPFDQAFPHGAFVVGEVEPVNDFDKSTADKPVQQMDKITGLPVWQVPVMDGDESLRARQKTVTVKIAAEHQPVPPEKMAGTPFRPVEFTDMTVTPYVDTNGPRPRQGFSFRASGMRKPGKAAGAVKDAA